jgi:serine/threonine protein phosphatase PrpC
VFDGHGGSEVADQARAHLHNDFLHVFEASAAEEEVLLNFNIDVTFYYINDVTDLSYEKEKRSEPVLYLTAKLVLDTLSFFLKL